METYEYTEKCREISGFGGGYEETCRKMVKHGMKWLDENPNAKPEFKQFKNIYGITTDENNDMKLMQDYMCDSVGGDVTGAMMQATTNHVLFAWKNGWDKYLEKMEEED